MSKPKRITNMLRFAMKHKMQDATLIGIVSGGETKASVYGRVIGKHPTKKGRHYVQPTS